MTRTGLACAWMILAGATAAAGQAGGIERVNLETAVERALSSSPAMEQAVASIGRAEAILRQTRALALPSLSASLTSTTIGPVPEFSGLQIVPRTQLNTAAAVTVPVLAPVRWAERVQAGDQVTVARRGREEVRRQLAVSTAQAYLAVIGARRLVELNERALDNARAHHAFAEARYREGLGSRLNALRAEQEVSGNEARVEEARLALRRAQEALGVLAATDGPLDADGEPSFEVSGDLAGEASAPGRASIAIRPDLRLLDAREAAATRVLADSWREYLPEVTAFVSPQLLTPSGLFAPRRSWSASVQFAVPVFDFGQRSARSAERRSLLQSVRAERAEGVRRATAEVRTAREAVAATERALTRTRAAAAQASEVVQITDVAFREGATTNIEVIDAQRRARDAETEAAVAEDALRRARLDLLVALGRFPG